MLFYVNEQSLVAILMSNFTILTHLFYHFVVKKLKNKCVL